MWLIRDGGLEKCEGILEFVDAFGQLFDLVSKPVADFLGTCQSVGSKGRVNDRLSCCNLGRSP
jgi:hypothetical protein